MRRGRLPTVYDTITEELIKILPKYESATIMRMLRNRNIEFTKIELRKIIAHLQSTYKLLAPKKKILHPPGDLNDMRNYFLLLMDKAEQEPSIITQVHRLAENDNFLTIDTKKSKLDVTKIICGGKRKIIDTSTDSEEDTVSSNHSAQEATGWAVNELDTSSPNEAKDYSDSVDDYMLSNSPNSFQLFSTSPVQPSPQSSSSRMPPPLSIPPPALNDKIQNVLKFHAYLERPALGVNVVDMTSVPTHGSETFTDVDSNDTLEDLNDDTLELLKSLLDSPRSSHEDESVNTQEVRAEDKDSRKISICFKAKRSLETWDWYTRSKA